MSMLDALVRRLLGLKGVGKATARVGSDTFMLNVLQDSPSVHTCVVPINWALLLL
jgi:hypothetical protein